MKSLDCPKAHRPHSRKGAIIRHGFYKTTWGKRRRYQCQTCGKTFCPTNGTPYYRIQHRCTTFDEVAGLSISRSPIRKDTLAVMQKLQVSLQVLSKVNPKQVREAGGIRN
jgi:transposase-like protein